MTTQRIGLIVPSSNITMETEVPALLGHEDRACHSSSAAPHNVDAESLHAMVGEGDRCPGELADAGTDVIGYACLVTLMAGAPVRTSASNGNSAPSPVEPVQRALGLPVVIATTATAREPLRATGTAPRIPGGGAALDEEVRRVEH
ncbi:maleate cis-trans isomerase [Actinopolyspora biskrensis]|uniref:Maleate cis-trans isomerase n=1 Tax=Actinopolyspora biskrensis TaxID=1470178 RepID=A0A852YSE6_9ACTN|nr:hypothetical protein [Actinopolyspora biskrensis]NYH77631.1 maleate cis-trans isomerase [Actinopolyspora biskrensis]